MKTQFHIYVRTILLCLMCMAGSGAFAQADPDIMAEEPNIATYIPPTTSYIADPDIRDGGTASGDEERPRKRRLIDAIMQYLDDSNKEKKDKKIDFSFLGGPFYSSEAKLGIGLVAAAVYRTDCTDTLCIPSNISIYGDISTSLLYSIGLSGNHIMRHGNTRLTYDVDFVHFPTKFWGIGYQEAKDKSNETKYTEFSIRTKLQAMWQFHPRLFAGPTADIDHVRATDIKGNVDLWDGQPLTTTDIGIGLMLEWDTRDNLTSPERGWLISLEQKFFPRFLANGDHNFSLTEFSGNFYFPAWKGSTIATRAHGRFTYGKTPWSMLSSVGGSYTLRGYYENRYRDKSSADLTVELRQKIWKRWGAVAWGGIGSVFHGKNFSLHRLLPNWGVGIRWEFKKHVNVRLDYGWGQGESGIVFNINEAF